MMRYTPALVASVRHDVENTDKPFARIALDHGISERTINRWRDRDGWARRSERVHDVPPAMRALQEATTLLATKPAVSEPPGGEDPQQAAPESPIARIEKLIERELAAEEAARAQLGALARTPADAERCARTLATLTQTLHALTRLRGGLAPDSGPDYDDIPADIDEFRRELARRIDAFVASRTDGGNAGGNSATAVVDEAR
jgi:transposase-like protein